MSRNVSCNLETGVCDVNLDIDMSDYVYRPPVIKDKVLVEYFTDPLCSACFVFEPVIDQLVSQYEDQIDFKIILGGMMPKNTFVGDERYEMADGIEQMGSRFNMPMSGELMRTAPVSSSYPPSLAYLAVKKQDESLSVAFMRRLREAVYLEDRDVSKEAVLVELVSEFKLDTEQFLLDFYSPNLLDELEENIKYTAINGVSGFPSVVIYGLDKQGMIVRGVNDLAVFKEILAKHHIHPNKKEYTLDNVLEKYHYLSKREIYDRLNVYFEDDLIAKLEKRDDVLRLPVSDGYYYRLKGA